MKRENQWKSATAAIVVLAAFVLAGCTGPPGGNQDDEDEHETTQDDEEIPHEPRDPSYAHVSISCGGLTCTFAGEAHLMNDEIDRYEWDFGDGNNSEHAVVDWTYAEPGNYSVSFTAYGKGGSSITEHDEVSVEAPDGENTEPGRLPRPD